MLASRTKFAPMFAKTSALTILTVSATVVGETGSFDQ